MKVKVLGIQFVDYVSRKTGNPVKGVTLHSCYPDGQVKGEAVDSILKYNFVKCYLGTNGISLSAGFTTPDPDEAAVKEAAVQKSYITYILADHSKFGQISSVTFAPLEKACLITDRASDARYKEKCVLKEVLSN